MASVSDLNIRLGVAYREFDKSMRQVENRLRQSAQTIGGIADNMMSAISVPILGLGAIAVKAAGDFEALRMALNTTMQDAGYSTQQTAKELEALRQIATAPGIDLEQAVKGSIRLQSVGIAADKARKILQEFSNAVAAGGGGADELNRVTVQLAQIQSKGVVLQEDLGVLKEAMPGITKAMQQAFGTTTAEGIRNAGINATQFIEGVTQALSNNARVQGGVKNAIDNARSALTQFFVSIGDGINEAYNLNQVAEDLSAWLGRVASAFRNLDPETKKSILNFALYAAAAGPVIKIFSSLFVAGQTFVSGLRTVAGAMANLGGGALTLIDKFGKLSTAMKFTYIGAAIAIVGALYMGFQKLNEGIDEAMHVTNQLNQVEEKAIGYHAEQQGKLDLLYKSVTNTTLSEKERKAALDELQALYPQYFSNLTLESVKTGQLEGAYDSLTEALKRSARVRAGQEQLNEITKGQLSLENQRLKLVEYYNKNLSDSNELQLFNNAVTQAGRDEVEKSFAQRRKDFAEELKAIDNGIAAKQREVDAVVGVIQANTDLTSSQAAALEQKRLAALAENNNAAATDNSTESSKKKKKAVEEETASMKDLINTLDMLDQSRSQGDRAGRGEIRRIATQGAVSADPVMPDLTELGDTAAIPGQQMVGLAEHIKEVDKAAAEAAAEHKKRIDELIATYGKWVETTTLSEASIRAFGSGLEAMAESAGPAFEGLAGSLMGVEGAYVDTGRAALVAAMQMVKAAIAATIAKAIQDSMSKSGHPLLGIAIAGIAVAGVSALFGRIQQETTKNVPKFAKGAVVYGPTMAMVGDNPNAGVDPEVISPLSKLQNIMGSAGQTISLNGNFKIRGQDLELVLAKASKTQQRIRGK